MGARASTSSTCRYAEALDMADRHVVFKQCLKELADAAGMSLTSWRSPSTAGRIELPHPLQPLARWQERTGEGRRTFSAGSSRLDGARAELMCSLRADRQFYKRYVDASWAPTRIAWSYDNRTAGFRVVGEGQSCESNAAFRRRLQPLPWPFAPPSPRASTEFEQDRGPQGLLADVYAAKNLPASLTRLAEATRNSKQSIQQNQAFGAEVVEHYSHFSHGGGGLRQRRDDWERSRYFERFDAPQGQGCLITAQARASAGRPPSSSRRKAPRSRRSTSTSKPRAKP